MDLSIPLPQGVVNLTGRGGQSDRSLKQQACIHYYIAYVPHTQAWIDFAGKRWKIIGNTMWETPLLVNKVKGVALGFLMF